MSTLQLKITNIYLTSLTKKNLYATDREYQPGQDVGVGDMKLTSQISLENPLFDELYLRTNNQDFFLFKAKFINCTPKKYYF